MVSATRCWCGGTVNVVGGQASCNDSTYHDPFATGEPTKIERIYVAGPMSGIPQCNYPAFNDASTALRAAGYEVVNPAEFGEGRHYVDFIREDLRLLLDCHAVAVLNRWWTSVGARNEVQVAGLLKMPVLPWKQWL